MKFTKVTDGFIGWYAWSLKFGDCDPAVWATNYLNRRFEHNSEQRLWFCWLYGNTYNLPTAWVMLNEFPDYELATVSRITQWNTKNYKRLRYQTDTKWNKGHLPPMFESYQSFIGKHRSSTFCESTTHGGESQGTSPICGVSVVRRTLVDKSSKRVPHKNQRVS